MSIAERIQVAKTRFLSWPDQYAKFKVAHGQKSLWGEEDEVKHPRNEIGEFAKKDSPAVIRADKGNVSPIGDENKPNGEKKMEAKEFTGNGGAKAVVKPASDGNGHSAVIEWKAGNSLHRDIAGKDFKGRLVRFGADGVQHVMTGHGEVMLDIGIVKIEGKSRAMKVRVSDKPELQAAAEVLLPEYKAGWEKHLKTQADLEQQEKQRREATRSDSHKIAPIYHDGEYLSGYQVYGDEAEILKDLGLAKHVSGWGYEVSQKVIKDLGKEFTVEQAKAYAKPAMDAKAESDATREEANKAKREVIENKKSEMVDAGKSFATPKQIAVIERARRDWFDIFDGAGGYGMNGPTDEQLELMTKDEASSLISEILASR